MPISKNRICAALTVLAIVGASVAQDGVSTAGAARTKYLEKLGILPASREVVVEDFVNYHRHEIGRPKSGEAVALDVRWGSESIGSPGSGIVQIGLATSLAHDRDELRPLNLNLVIDKSGSMSDADKMTQVKNSLLTLVSKLRPTDILSIVVFDSEANVLFPSQPVSTGETVRSLIRQIQPGSSTNINAGLMLGYQQAQEHFRKGWTNRVILLTDGIANVGVTDPAAISKASLGYNDRGIDLSTIGVGLDLNKDLLSTLAKSGRGLFHFVADPEDVKKVFDREMQSLISPVATEPNLEIELGPGLKIDKIYGYAPKISGNKATIKLDNMNSGMTEVVMMRVKTNGIVDQSKLTVKAKLSYRDLARKKQVEASDSASVNAGEELQGKGQRDDSVKKNFTIACLAQGIHDMALACEKQDYRQAESVLTSNIELAHRNYPNLEDEDIQRTLKVAEQYQNVLSEENQRRGVSQREGGNRPLGPSIIANGDFSKGNQGFSSDLDYIDPADNCLWSALYTIAPRFDNPQLHRLIRHQEYSSPRNSSGKEQVLFANAGGTGSLTVWTTRVRCKPNTTYKIRFQTISLTPGPEWIPTFEIRANKDRSEPQAAGAGEYAEVGTEWNSGSETAATISIVRMPIPHGGGLIGIANIEMVEVQKG